MAALQHTVQPFSPVSSAISCNSALAPRSCTPAISSHCPAPPYHQTVPLQARTSPKSEACAGASASSRGSRRSLVFLRQNAAAGYAAALLEIGRSRRILDRIHADLKKVACVLQHKPLCRLLLNPSVQDAHKLKIFARLAEEAAFQPYTLKIVNLMIEKKRTAFLKDLVKEFEMIYRTVASTKNSFILEDTELQGAHFIRTGKQIPKMAMDLLSETGSPSICLMGYLIDYGKHTRAATV